jgi:hypothetical protein
MSSRSTIDLSADTLQGVLANIQIATEAEEYWMADFVPVTVLGDIINRRAVKGVLLEHSSLLTLEPPIPMAELADFFSTKAYKVFAILAQNESLHLIEHFYQNGFQDDMLPVRKTLLSNRSKDWEIVPCKYRDCDGETAREKFRATVRKTFRCGGDQPRGPTPKEIKHFLEYWQWPFIAPVFVKEEFEYEFPDGIRLPFTWSAGPKPNSDFLLYSEVEEKSVHADHLPKDLVSYHNIFMI